MHSTDETAHEPGAPPAMTPEMEVLVSAVGKIAHLPLFWAVTAGALMFAAFCLLGFAVLIVVLMVKSARGVTAIINVNISRPVAPEHGGAIP